MSNIGNLEAFTTANPATINSQNKHVLRTMDDASYNSGHADETILLAGPSRIKAIQDWAGNALETVGVAMGVSWGESNSIQWHKAIGSARNFATMTGSQPVGIGLNTILLNGTSMLHNLYYNARLAGFDFANLDILPYAGQKKEIWLTLSSSIYKIPFGMGMILRDSSKRIISGVYFEHCFITSSNMQIAPGQPSISQSVQITCDRVIPWSVAIGVQDILKQNFDKANKFFGQS